MRLIVIGGGISGLAAAYYAARQANEQGRPLQLTVLESAGQWGGKILTERIPHDGGQFVVEGGPDTFLASKPWGLALCRELGLEDRLHGTNPQQKNTYVLHRGQLQPLPDGLALMIPTDVPSILRSRLVSWPGKVRMGLDFLLPARNGHADESLGGFVSRRLGREAYENLIEPLMSGIYAGDGDALSLQSTFPYLHDLESTHGSLARGALAMRRQMAARGAAARGSRSAFLTPTTGLAELVERLVERLSAGGADLRLNVPAAAVSHHPQGGSWTVTLDSGQALAAEALVLAAPAFAAGDLLEGLDPPLAAALRSIPYASTATVSLAYRQEDLGRPLDGYGYVIPRRERRRALACTWTSTKFPHRAPAGYALLRVFVGRAGQEIPWGQDELLALARQELALTLGIQAAPLLWRVQAWPRAMPQYNLGHPEKLARIEAALAAHPGLALAGNGYRGIGIPDCIHSGQQAAEKALAASQPAETS
jgi:protoporphyrinogen/coproporphyrinogen III oxidase